MDNTLQLNQQGGGRIDIPLPESGLSGIYEMNIAQMNFSLPLSRDGYRNRPRIRVSENPEGISLFSSNIPIFIRGYSVDIPPSHSNITSYKDCEGEILTEMLGYIKECIPSNFPDGNYEITLSAINDEFIICSGWANSIIIESGNVTTDASSIEIDWNGLDNLPGNAKLTITSIKAK